MLKNRFLASDFLLFRLKLPGQKGIDNTCTSELHAFFSFVKLMSDGRVFVRPPAGSNCDIRHHLSFSSDHYPDFKSKQITFLQTHSVEHLIKFCKKRLKTLICFKLRSLKLVLTIF